MNAAIILALSLGVFGLAYKLYGSFLDKKFNIDDRNITPAHSKYDGEDFMPAKNWIVLFGHHFSSICGAGPIVGPVLAVAYWGWAPSLIWILLGATLMGAVADYSSLVVSMRSEGEGIAEIAGPTISNRARLFFSWFIWILVILVVAVFAIFGAKTLNMDPTSVVPATGLIPAAMFTGWLLYAKKMNNLLATFIGLALLALLLIGGNIMPLSLPDMGFLSAQNLWILILLAYCLIASVTPVNLILQPRDYLASFLLFGTILIGLIGIFYNAPSLPNTAFHAWNPVSEWKGAGPLFPMLFVTIACGAISGFHSLVSSGTTCKQIDRETHACRIGYGGMLTEGLVAVLVLICVAAGLSSSDLKSTLGQGGPIAAFGQGFGNLSSFLLGDYASGFAILALNTFILTTLDSATRIARYLTMDLFHIKNKYIATMLVVLLAALLALSGQWSKFWPAFGTANQLIAGLSLLVASAWLIKNKKSSWYTLIPGIIMMITTTCAFIYQLTHALFASVNDELVMQLKDSPDYFIALIAMILLSLSFVVIAEMGKRTLST
ncbi:MAG: carbon starvation protein A [Deltaproteobacteria bacterium]|nr:carbon starvation protein A [Deltaproteobacteria bacterium]